MYLLKEKKVLFLDGAEIFNLVGLYILSKVGNVFSNCGLGVIDLAEPVVYDRTRKQVFKVMSDIGFIITLDLGNQVTDFFRCHLKPI